MGKKKLTIAFLGTDGSGKSTIIEAICPILSEAMNMEVKYEHLRPNYLPSLGVALGKRTKEAEENFGPVTNPHNSRPSGFVGSMMRLFYYLIDYTYGYYKKVYLSKGLIWIFDRYYYDYLIDPLRYRIKIPSVIIRIFGHIIPAPDFIFCLGGDPVAIYSRKPETDIKEVTRQVSALRTFCNNSNRSYWVDTTQDIDSSVSDVLLILGIK